MRPPPRPHATRRYGWFRQYNDFPTHPKWAVVSRMSGAELCRVLAIVTCLEVTANKGTPRGSIADFSVQECAAGLRIKPAAVQKVYEALEKLGWIDREYLSTWDERQPDKEDPTAKDRQQRRRQKIREQNQSDFAVSRRDKRDVTPRLDQTNKTAATEPVNIPSVGKRTGLVTAKEAAEIAEQQRKERQLNLYLKPVGLKGSGSR